MIDQGITTAAGHTFHSTGNTGQHLELFTVTPGVPLLAALESASNLLSMMEDSIYSAAMGITPLQGNAAWLVNHALETAKATIDAAIDGLEYPDSGQAAQE